MGAGTLGPVFRAHDPGEGRLVAIKAFRLDLTPDRAAELARALDELVTRGLSHPSTAAPLAAGVEGATPWLAQTYVPAESLDAALRQYGPAPTAHVVTIVTHLAGALDFAAASGVLHGSLHPRDVLVAPDETYLIDLGVAPALERCGLRPPIRRPYSAPERVAGEPISRASDIFALAAVTYELLIGQPIAGTDDTASAALPDVPGADMPQLKCLFAEALARDPAVRPATALTFASTFKTALGSASFRSTPAVVTRQSQRITPTPVLPLEPAPEVADAGEAAPKPAPVVLPVQQGTGAEIAIQASDAPRAASVDVVVPAPAEAVEPLLREQPEARPVSRLDDLELAPPGRVASRDPRSPASRRVPALVSLVLLGLVLGFGLGWMWVAKGNGTSSSDSSGIPAPAAPVRTETESVVTDTPPETVEAPAVPPPAGEPAPTPELSAESAAPTPAREAPEPGAAAALESVRTAVAPVPGRLLVRSTPAGASVEVNGRSRGRTPLALRDLPLGGHTIVVSRPGYQSERRRVTLTRSRATQSLQVPLRATAPAAVSDERPDASESARAGNAGFIGTVLVESRPSAARVVIDGREAGRTPLVVPNVRAGSHVVRIELEGYRTWTASVRVVAGERRRVAASLEEMTR